MGINQSDPHTFDAVIVGAGPAGATAAYVLARQGLKILILEQARFPRRKICGGLITWKTLRVLKAVFDVSAHTLRTRGVLFHESRKYCLSNYQRILFESRQKDPFCFVDRKATISFGWTKRFQPGLYLSRGIGSCGWNPVPGGCTQPEAKHIGAM